MRLRPTDSLHYASRIVRLALQPADPQRSASAVRVYAPDGTLRAELTVDEWRQRFPHRLTPRRPRG